MAGTRRRINGAGPKQAISKDITMYKEYQPIAETLDLVWRYDPKIFGEKWRDWKPNTLTPSLFSYYRLN